MYPRWVNECKLEVPKEDMFHIALKLDTPNQLFAHASRNFSTYHGARKVARMWAMTSYTRNVIMTKPDGSSSMFVKVGNELQERRLG